MQLHPIDIAIVLLYLVAVVVVGVMLSRRAGENLDSYFLGGNTIPWYVLGVSNASSMFDITGTMWLVYIVFVYGLKGTLLPWIWPTFNQIFLMIYLSVWIRRSGVLTGGEWMTTRFSEKGGGELARISVVIFALLAVISYLGYAFKGIGKFAVVFFPWDLSPDMYAVIIMSITTIYVIVGGMYSVVMTDVIQFVLLTVVSFFIGYIAIEQVSSVDLAAAIPAGWMDLSVRSTLGLDWSGLLPAVNDKIASDGYELFNIVVMMMLFKGVLVSLAGPTPGYDLQRVLATRTPREAALMSSMPSIALFPRWLMIAGITVLGLVYVSPELAKMGPDIDFEMILPYVLNNFIPVGLLGLLLAGLLAGFMSTFDSTVNAGASYLVVDFYKRYINPEATNRTYVKMSYLASIFVVILGFIFGFASQDIDSVMQWLVAGLFGGFAAPNLLKWHWWRLNGHGYFWGMIAGIAAAMSMSTILPGTIDLFRFQWILLVATAASIAASMLTAPDDKEVLKSFYKNVRPWGMWGPVREMVQAEDPGFEPNKDFGRNAISIAVGIVWQMTWVLGPVYLVLQQWENAALAGFILVLTSAFLKKYWYDKLED